MADVVGVHSTPAGRRPRLDGAAARDRIGKLMGRLSPADRTRLNKIVDRVLLNEEDAPAWRYQAISELTDMVQSPTKAIDPKLVADLVKLVKTFDALADYRASHNERTAEIDRLNKLAGQVHDRDHREALVKRAAELADRDPARPGQLRLEAEQYRERASKTATTDESWSWRTAAAKLEQRADDLEKVLRPTSTKTPTPTITLDQLHARLAREAAEYHARIDAVAKTGGLDLPAHTPTLTKSASIAAKFLAVHDDFAGLRKRLDWVMEQPLGMGPTRIPRAADASKQVALDARRGQAAEYRRLAGTVTDRDLAAGYRKLAAELEQPHT